MAGRWSRCLLIVLATAAWGQTGSPRFEAAGAEFVFDTGVLSGKVRQGGRSTGLSRVVHTPTGVTISSGMGLAGHYRVFTRNRRYGDAAWHWPSEARLNPQGELEVRWPAAGDRPFELQARYRWLAPEALLIETRVRAVEQLTDFESFLASYLSKDFNFAAALAGSPPQWVPASPDQGVWQMFPRDAAALALVSDGRWKIPPSPVDWAIRPPLAEPIAIRTAHALGLTVAVLAPRDDCFAVAMPHHQEQHYSLYLSLFGRTIAAGETAVARALLAVLPQTDAAAVQRLCRGWLARLAAEQRSGGARFD